MKDKDDHDDCSTTTKKRKLKKKPCSPPALSPLDMQIMLERMSSKLFEARLQKERRQGELRHHQELQEAEQQQQQQQQQYSADSTPSSSAAFIRQQQQPAEYSLLQQQQEQQCSSSSSSSSRSLQLALLAPPSPLQQEDEDELQRELRHQEAALAERFQQDQLEQRRKRHRAMEDIARENYNLWYPHSDRRQRRKIKQVRGSLRFEFGLLPMPPPAPPDPPEDWRQGFSARRPPPPHT